MAEDKPACTITEFFNESQNLVTGVAAFTALSAFVNQLPGELAKSDHDVSICVGILSGLLSLLAELTLLEVVKNVHRYQQRGMIRLFSEILFWAFALYLYLWAKVFYAGVQLILILFIVAFVVLALFGYFRFLGIELWRLFQK
jgi:hypothetical protein